MAEGRREGGGAAVEKKDKDKDDVVKLPPPSRSFWRRKWTFSDKRSLAFILLTHSLALLAPFYFTWTAFFVAFSLYVTVGLFGINISYHRNLTHKSFKLPKFLEYLFAYFGMFALQGDPIDWVSTHRFHHQYVDSDRDPHSPIQGFWFSHMAWIMDSYVLTKKVNPEFSGDFQEIPRNIFKLHMIHGKPNHVSDLEEQWFYRFVRQTYLLHLTAAAAALYLAGGLPFLTWGGGVAGTWGFHITFLVNSVCHTWGQQPWDTGDLSKNNGLVALATFGEGWHNNHHAFEYSARHGLQWWELDVTWWVIRILQGLGLATQVKLPTEKQKLAKKFPKAANGKMM